MRPAASYDQASYHSAGVQFGLLLPHTMAASNNDAAIADVAAPPAQRGGGGFPQLRNRRLSAAFCFAVWGAAGILYTTVVPNLAANPSYYYHNMLCFLLFMVGVFQLLLSISAPNLP